MLVHVHTHTCTHLHMRSHVCTRMHDIVHMCTYMCVLQRHLGCLPPGVALQWPVQRPRDGLCPLPRASRGHRSHGCGRCPRDARGTYHHVVDVVRFLEGHFLAFSAFSAFAFCKYNMGVHASRPQCLTTNTRFRRHGGRTAPDSQQPRLQGPGWSRCRAPGGRLGGKGMGRVVVWVWRTMWELRPEERCQGTEAAAPTWAGVLCLRGRPTSGAPRQTHARRTRRDEGFNIYRRPLRLRLRRRR